MSRTVDISPDRVRGDKVAGAVIVGSAGIALGLVVLANVRPYARLVAGVSSRALGLNLPPVVAWPLGVVLLAGIQAGEIRPLLLHRPSADTYRRAATVAAIAYTLDLTLAVANWPPLRVPLARFWAAPSLGDVNWLNVAMIGAIAYGPELLVRLIRAVRADLD